MTPRHDRTVFIVDDDASVRDALSLLLSLKGYATATFATAESLLGGEWNRPYTREAAAYPVAALRSSKYWAPVGRVDNVWGDRNLSCSCIPVSDYA